METSFFLPQVLAIVALAVVVVIVGWALLRNRRPAVLATVENAIQRAELSVEGYTEGELVKLSTMIVAHLSDDSADQAEINQASADAAARTANANARIAQRAAARAKVSAMLMGSKLSA